ncbi:class I SAM-dependent methyltransferase [Akkermansiaceae bacterium]|nr:class I SAM-dependent methyltransferase [Akkermansiaceae bacterium]
MKRIEKNDVVSFWDRAAKTTRLTNKEGVGMLTEGNEYYARARTMEEFQLLDKLVSRKNKKILEIGCGSGRYAPYFARRGISYLGIDISGEMISLAKSIYGNNDPLIKFLHIDDVSVLNDHFDLIIFGGITQYLNDDEVSEIVAKCSNLTNGQIITRDTLALRARQTITNADYPVVYRTGDELNDEFIQYGWNLARRLESCKIKLLAIKVNFFYQKIPSAFMLLYCVHRLFLIFYKPLRPLVFVFFSRKFRIFGDKKHMFSVYERS